MAIPIPQPDARSGRWQLLVCALMAAAVVTAFAPAMDVFLAGDDFEWLTAAYDLIDHPLSSFELINHFFRPLVKWTYLTDYLVFGQNSAGYIATSLLIHFFNSAMLFFLLRRRRVRPLVAAGAASAFALAPLHSEAVLWAAGRPDTVLLACWLGALLLLDRCCDEKGLGRAAAFTVVAVLGIGAKESWILFPFIASGYLIWVRRESIGASLRRIAVVWAAWLVYVVWFLVLPALSGQATAAHYADFSVLAALVKTSNTLLSYCTLGWAPFVGGLFGVLLAGTIFGAAAAVLARGDNRFGCWALFWLASTLTLTAPFPMSVLRHNYLPLAGFWMLAAAVIDHWLAGAGTHETRLRQAGSGLLLGAILVVLIVEGWMLQREIADYRRYGDLHSRLHQSFAAIEPEIPRGKPLVLVNHGSLRGVELMAASVEGVDKTFFVRTDALWQLVFLPPLADFTGRPFSERLVSVDTRVRDLTDSGCTVVLFDDHGFQLRPDLEPSIIAALNAGRGLPPGAGVYRYQQLR